MDVENNQVVTIQQKMLKTWKGIMKWSFTKGKSLQNRFIRTNEEFAFIADDDDITDEMRALPVPTEGK